MTKKKESAEATPQEAEAQTKSVGLYGTDKIAEGLVTIVDVVDDLKEARREDSAGGKKITWPESVGIVMANAGKVIKFAGSIDEMGKQVADLEAKESPEICAAVEKLYSPKNPYVKSGSEKLVTGGLWIKEGVEDLLKAKEWEASNKGE
jgi:hypothetical protein